MENEIKSYRVRTAVGDEAPNTVSFKLDQTFEFVNILSLTLSQTNMYKMPSSGYGCVVGRVMANGGFGIPNAKVSVFVPIDNTVFDVQENILYNYTTSRDPNMDGVRYNLLPSKLDAYCHQDVGTMFEKEFVLDNNDVIKVFDKYYTYTTVTNNAGDYMIYGIPVGRHTIHVDLDLSDIGVLSQRPRDMIYKGYNPNMFEKPNKFKTDKNLNSLAQIYSQDSVKYIYPFWGDTSEDMQNGTITRCDVQVDYKFEPTCVFLGSIISDKAGNGISHDCVPTDNGGKMSELITGPGRIEMIRKTFDGKVEQFSIKGNKLIDDNGVWCYQIPMNLDYVMTDEFGNTVPTDNPNKGIPTRTRARFRIYMDETETDLEAMKRARFLVPNNPRPTTDYPDFNRTHEIDYEFGTYTKDESYRDLFWNDVYTVKSYIPRLQKKAKVRKFLWATIWPTTKQFTGIKTINHAGDNNPMPYNNVNIKLTFLYSFICIILKVFVAIVSAINAVLTFLGWLLMEIFCIEIDLGFVSFSLFGSWCNKICKFVAKWPIGLSNFCSINGEDKTWYIGIDDDFFDKVNDCSPNNGLTDDDIDLLYNCIENQLAQENEVTHFNFQNDWVNGVLYAPLWFRKIKGKKSLFFGLFKIPGTDRWCDAGSSSGSNTTTDFNDLWTGWWNARKKKLKLYQTCAPYRTYNGKQLDAIQKGSNSKDGEDNEADCYEYQCHKAAIDAMTVDNGLVLRKETMLNEYVYYYRPLEYDSTTLSRFGGGMGDVKLLYATDLVLLGSLNDCDNLGIPQFFKYLTGTTYQMPPDLLMQAYNIDETASESSEGVNDSSLHTEYTGADWGNAGKDQYGGVYSGSSSILKEGSQRYDNGGVFYGIDCTDGYTKPKSCINASRACEVGVDLDQTDYTHSYNGTSIDHIKLTADGFISYDELGIMDIRAMFATMNGNNLRTKANKNTGYPEYDFIYLYPENFDGSLQYIMGDLATSAMEPDETRRADLKADYFYNYKLESQSQDYTHFRFSFNPLIVHADDTVTDPYTINYYNSTEKINDRPVTHRFPRYENSFYFYFGLKTGKTAMDVFRSDYYADCTNDAAAEASLIVKYQPNSWCSGNDGWISVDASFADTPFRIELDNRDSDCDYTNDDEINAYKFYVGSVTNQALDDEGYTFVPVSTTGSGCGNPLPTGYYTLTLTDSNDNVYTQNINFKDKVLTFDLNKVNFIKSNEELFTQFGDSAFDTIRTYSNVGTNGLKRDIGGYITLSNVNLYNGDSGAYEVSVTYNKPTQPGIPDPIPGYSSNQIFYCRYYNNSYHDYNPGNGYIESNGELTVFLPIGYSRDRKVKYTVTVTYLCQDSQGRYYAPTDNNGKPLNSVSQEVIVTEGTEFNMYVNGVDTGMLNDFTPGWMALGDVYQAPYSTYHESAGIDTHVNGWLDFGNIGSNVVLIPSATTSMTYQADIEPVINGLVTNGGVYKWKQDYCFNVSEYEISIDAYRNTPPLVEDPANAPYYIVVSTLDSNNEQHNWLYTLTGADSQYVSTNNEVGPNNPTLKDYFNNSKLPQRQQVIDDVNNIVQMRLDFVKSMRNAFWMRDGESKSYEVTTQTNDRPVKTMIYLNSSEVMWVYIEHSGTPSDPSIYIEQNYVPQETTADAPPHIKVGDKYYDLTYKAASPSGTYAYYRYDENLENGTVYGLTIPTITWKNDKPIFYKNQYSGMYQAPMPTAVASISGVTRPVLNPASPLGYNCTNNGEFLCGSTDMKKMFAGHLIDKHQELQGILWAPMASFEYYPVNGQVNNEFFGSNFTMNGLLAGYFYNGFSTSGTQEAEFSEQVAAENVGFYTLNGFDEYSEPTKRLIHNCNAASMNTNYSYEAGEIKDGSIPTSYVTIPSGSTDRVSLDGPVSGDDTYHDPRFVKMNDSGKYFEKTLGYNQYDNYVYDAAYTTASAVGKYQCTPININTRALKVRDEAGTVSHQLLTNLKITVERDVFSRNSYSNIVTNNLGLPMTYYIYQNEENPIYSKYANNSSRTPDFMKPDYVFPVSKKVGDNIVSFAVNPDTGDYRNATKFYVIGVYDNNGISTRVVSKEYELSHPLLYINQTSDTIGVVFSRNQVNNINYLHAYLWKFNFSVRYNTGINDISVNVTPSNQQMASVSGSGVLYSYINIANIFPDDYRIHNIYQQEELPAIYITDITGMCLKCSKLTI